MASLSVATGGFVYALLPLGIRFGHSYILGPDLLDDAHDLLPELGFELVSTIETVELEPTAQPFVGVNRPPKVTWVLQKTKPHGGHLMKPPNYMPRDAGKLLLDRRLIEFACSVTKNRAFGKADARTRDAHGRRVVDYVRSAAERDAWPARLGALLRLPPSEFERAMGLEPVRLSAVPKPDGRTRVVGVPTFIRRCASNLLKDVLERTGDHLLPPCVRAYRPGSKDAVQNTLLDVAQGIRDGRVRYWAKIDFRSFFSVMPWWGIEEALLHYGYREDFTALAMTTVNCPLVKKVNGRMVPVPNERGAQMGLAESSTLANMLPWRLDERFENNPRLVYLRYSDDLFIGSAIKCEVVGAVRHVQAWADRYDIPLKGVSPDVKAAKLVHDVKNARVELLGAEIDQNGEVHLPLSKLKAKLGEIQHRDDNLVTEGVIAGVSRYGDGGGTHLFDLDDLVETIQGFLSYWRDLDPRGARQAEALIHKTFRMPAQTCIGGHGTVWLAQL